MTAREAQRHQLLAWRAARTAAEVDAASAAIAEAAVTHAAVRGALRVGAYAPRRREIDPTAIVQRVWGQGKRVYLPVVTTTSVLEFGRWRPGEKLRAGPFGLHQPGTHARRVAPQHLDTVLVPLVAFDRRGNRLGHGAGYYDATFAHRRATRTRRPVLIGLAYAAQELPSIEPAAWDVPLDWVITEHEVIPARVLRRIT